MSVTSPKQCMACELQLSPFCILYARIMEWPCPSGRPSVCPSVCPSTIACERDILTTARRIDSTFWYGFNTTKTSDAIDLGHSTKTEKAATTVGRLAFYPMQDSACESEILTTACWIDFTFWHGLHTTKTSDAIDLGYSTKNKMAAIRIWRLTFYPMRDIACERGSLKTACRIDFTFWNGLTFKKWMWFHV